MLTTRLALNVEVLLSMHRMRIIAPILAALLRPVFAHGHCRIDGGGIAPLKVSSTSATCAAMSTGGFDVPRDRIKPTISPKRLFLACWVPLVSLQVPTEDQRAISAHKMSASFQMSTLSGLFSPVLTRGGAPAGNRTRIEDTDKAKQNPPKESQ
jgi:hypothetical protein